MPQVGQAGPEHHLHAEQSERLQHLRQVAKKAKLDTKTYEITSPSLTACCQPSQSWIPPSPSARKALPATLVGGGLVLLALILSGPQSPAVETKSVRPW